MTLLDVSDLRVELPTAAGMLAALRGVSFSLPAGGTLGLIGESGCGKSLTALALMNLLPEGARVQGSVRLNGQELLGLPENDWCRLRGRRIAMVFQEPMTALNPLHPVGRQIAEPLRLHHGLDAAAARAQALRLLERVQLPQARARLDAYPHQLSGGQRQRVMIAIALAAGPDLLVADEPTTALDATLQREVLALLLTLVREDGMGLLLISHDLGVMAEHVAQLAVMYAGRIVEAGTTETVFARRAHPYTRGLHAARPRLGARRTQQAAGVAQRLATIPGRVPALQALGPGCAFAPRCSRAQPDCQSQVPPLSPVLLPMQSPLPSAGPTHRAACLHPWPADAAAAAA